MKNKKSSNQSELRQRVLADPKFKKLIALAKQKHLARLELEILEK